MKMTKKVFAALALIAAVSLAGCGNSANSTNTANTKDAASSTAKSTDNKDAASSAAKTTDNKNAKKIRFATGGTTGTYYAYGGVISQTLQEVLPDISLTVHSSGASKANIFEIVDGEADMALVQNDVADYAYKGTDLFEKDGPSKGFSALGGAYSEVVQVVANSSINSIADLKGKTVSVGDAGSGTEFNARQLLDAYGLSFNDIKVQNLSFGDSAEALKDGKIDAFFCVAGAPTTAVVELATTNSIHVLSVDEDKMQVLKSKYPFYTEYKIPAGTYKGVDNEVTSAAVKATFIVSDKLDEDTVYQMTKAIFENKSKIAHAKAEQLDPKFAVEGITIPFHPGAQKYYKEVGAMK